jgi:hypothetical protein
LPKGLVAGLDGQDVVGGFDGLVEVPLQDRLQLELEAGGLHFLAEFGPRGGSPFCA